MEGDLDKLKSRVVRVVVSRLVRSQKRFGRVGWECKTSEHNDMVAVGYHGDRASMLLPEPTS